MNRIGRYLTTIGLVGALAFGIAAVRRVAGYELTYLPTDKCIWLYSPASPDLEPGYRVGIVVGTNDPNVVNKVGKICIGECLVTAPGEFSIVGYGNDTTNDDVWDDRNGDGIVDPCELILDYKWEDMNGDGVIEPNEYTTDGNGIYDIFKDGAFDYEPLEIRIWDANLMREHHAETEPNSVVFDPAYGMDFLRVDLSKGELVAQPCGGWDLNGSGGVGFDDYSMFAARWGESCGQYNDWCDLCDGGIEGSGEGARDGTVDSLDLGSFVGSWLEVCE